MTQNFVVVIGMLVLYLCSFFGLVTAWVSYRKYKSKPISDQQKDEKTGGNV